MVEDLIGFKSPPTATQFKPGVSGNPNGRRQKPPTAFADAINDALSGVISYTEGGRRKSASGLALVAREVVKGCFAKDVESFETLFALLLQADREHPGGGPSIVIEGWLPDAPIALPELADDETDAGPDFQDVAAIKAAGASEYPQEHSPGPPAASPLADEST